MKKILIALLLPILILTSCNSDDNGYKPKPAETLTLHLTTRQTEGFVNKPIYFTLKDSKDTYGISGANIINLADKKALTSNVFKPTIAGTYQFQAKSNNSGTPYKDSEIVTVTITEPTKKTITLKNTPYRADNAILKIKRINSKDKNGNNNVTDKLVRLDNTYYNEYVLEVNNKGEHFIENLIEITFLVVNKSVKHNNGVITDYGQRVYPTALTEIVLTQVISHNKPSTRITTFDQLRESDLLVFYKIDIPNDNSQVITKSYFEFNLNDMGIDYAGDLNFTEFIEQ
ncbi:hypothetical protein SAMN04488018_10632 [Myroides marinus]|uniref:Uncharacterized protein n=2 Tax=Flavobacteriaceae TaxID=49546 RepID=A0A1H6UGD8_9FLAO|nr:hypothetical protein [Myroides marinus]MDM1371611.1 hypothetical protein [Myroides marinus]SEI87175.1 hypothetical protein SAMN04488018_10632 [Myroides marinus]